MPPSTSVAPDAPRDQHWLTWASIAVVACVLADMSHEALGHMLVASLSGARVLSLSTVAIQTVDGNRAVSAAGTAANIVAGVIALLLFGHVRRLTPAACFIWLFAAFNLLNCGYLVFSAASNTGDWAAVIQGYAPAWLWRCVVALIGIILYALCVRALTRSMVPRVVSHQISIAGLHRGLWTAYLASGVVMTLAAMFNPISRSLILISGIGASFGLNWGMLLVQGRAIRAAKGSQLAPAILPVNPLWVGLAVVTGGAFAAIFGPGVRFYE